MFDRRGFLQRSALALLAPRGRPDRRPLVEVHINPEMRVKVARGPARAELVEGDWRSFLVKVRNEAGTTAALRVTTAGSDWLHAVMSDEPTLSGVECEYRVIRLYCHAAGLREATVVFDVGQGTQDLGFRNEVPVLFDCRRRCGPACHPERSEGSCRCGQDPSLRSG